MNQLPYEALQELGWDPWLVVPLRWRHDYSPTDFAPERLPTLARQIVPRRVVFPGLVQRHFYVTDVAQAIDRIDPAIAFIEAEPTAIPTFQWGRALKRAGVPFGVQAAENLRRSYPLPARLIRDWCMRSASFVVARSPTAATLIQERAPSLPAPVVPHHVPEWSASAERRGTAKAFTVGYAGRLVPEKGLDTLVEAVSSMPDARLQLVGDGPLRGELERQARSGAPIEILSDVTHEQMPQAYAEFDVLALPSRTTATWVEQFGRVLVEALWCGVPIVGSDSGEIPWVVESTGGGLVFREDDVADLRRAIEQMRSDETAREAFAERGRASVRERFSVPAVAGALDDALRAALPTAPQASPTTVAA